MERDCQQCGKRFTARRADALYCSSACRQAALRARRGVQVARRRPEPTSCDFEEAFRENVWCAIDDVKIELEDVKTGLEDVKARRRRRGERVKKLAARVVDMEKVNAELRQELAYVHGELLRLARGLSSSD